jgi:hypothetical protein
LTGTLFALSLILLGADDMAPAGIVPETSLTIDACIAVDKATVQRLMEIEISDAQLRPASVSVGCVDGAQEVRIRRAGPLGKEDVRPAHIAPATDNDTPAERQARARELALAIAEFIRWPGLPAQPPRDLAAPEQPPAAPVPEPPIVVTQLTMVSEPRWQAGILCAFDHFSRGQNLIGADLLAAAHARKWFLVELRIGGRLGSNGLGSGPNLTTRAAAAAVTAGMNLWSTRHLVGAAVVMVAQGYLAQFRSDGSGERAVTTPAFGALAIALEPRLMATLTPHLAVEASGAIGWVPHGIVVRIQGVEAPSISGFAVSAKLGGVLTF